MLDIKRIRADSEEVKKALARRNPELVGLVDEVLKIDEERRGISSITDEIKAKQNKASKEIGKLKKKGEEDEALVKEMKALSDTIKENDGKISALEEAQKNLLLSIPNTPHESVAEGASDEDNEEVRKYGVPRVFSFEAKPHWDLGKALNILDPERAAKVTGSRFHFLKGDGSRLSRSIMNFFMDTHSGRGYKEITTPIVVSRDSMTGTGQLPKFEDDAFHLDEPDYFLIPTAEVPVTNLYREEILDGANLPEGFCAYSYCFRKEAGSAGRDTRGLIRQHQFEKVELVKFTTPENSMGELEALLMDAEYLLKLLELPYRVVNLCTGDLGFSSMKTYDIEVWMPSYNRYVEISSCSNFGDYQARRAGIKYKDGAKGKANHVHTLNGSGLAIGRTIAAILENYQNEDGSIIVPEVLRTYMGKNIIS